VAAACITPLATGMVFMKGTPLKQDLSIIIKNENRKRTVQFS
jgi:hypothetical protein